MMIIIYFECTKFTCVNIKLRSEVLTH